MKQMTWLVTTAILCWATLGIGLALPHPQADQRPTLRGGKGSSRMPNTSFTMNARALMRVHTIFIEPIENRLGIKIADDLSKLGRFRLAVDKRQADAVLSGTCLDATHLKLLHSEVFLSNRVTGAAIWQDEIRLPLDPPPLRKALRQTAQKVTQDLMASMRRAEGR